MEQQKTPIHKFNGGIGATLCTECNKIISEGMTEDLYCDDCNFKYKLIRSDGLQRKGTHLTFVEWNPNLTFKEGHDEPAIGRSVLLDGNRFNYTWLTTTIKEIVQMSENYIKFETENSTYELFINK
jgi:hypothetical protein